MSKERETGTSDGISAVEKEDWEGRFFTLLGEVGEKGELTPPERGAIEALHGRLRGSGGSVGEAEEEGESGESGAGVTDGLRPATRLGASGGVGRAGSERALARGNPGDEGAVTRWRRGVPGGKSPAREEGRKSVSKGEEAWVADELPKLEEGRIGWEARVPRAREGLGGEAGLGGSRRGC